MNLTCRPVVTERTASLLLTQLGKAKGQLEAWRAAAEAQSQLTNAMRSAQSAADVEAAIQQASAVGIRVSKAKKLLRALQVLEGTLAQGSTHHGSLASLEEAIKVAAMAGVNQTVIRRACGELVSGAREAMLQGVA